MTSTRRGGAGARPSRIGPQAPGLRMALLLAGALACAGCGPRVIRETVFENENTRVLLRRVESGTPHGPWAHPATISDVRIAHILAALTHSDDDGRRPAIRALHVYDLAEGMAKAFDRATPSDEVIGIAFARDRRMGIFTDDRVTSFRSHIEGDELVIEFFAIEQEREDARAGRSDVYRPPLELPGSPEIELVPGQAQRRHGHRGVAVVWRDDYYRKPVNLRFRAGQVKRRTVLMEMPVDSGTAPSAQPELAPVSTPDDLEPAQRAALERLERARRAGDITEAEYRRRSRRILEGFADEDPGP